MLINLDGNSVTCGYVCYALFSLLMLAALLAGVILANITPSPNQYSPSSSKYNDSYSLNSSYSYEPPSIYSGWDSPSSSYSYEPPSIYSGWDSPSSSYSYVPSSNYNVSNSSSSSSLNNKQTPSWPYYLLCGTYLIYLAISFKTGACKYL